MPFLRPSILLLAVTTALPAVFAAQYDVQVGQGGQLRYDPQWVNAVEGDVVNFVFHPKNHTATQSSFDNPCSRIDGGFASGFQPRATEDDAAPTFQYQVTGTDPVWVYCGQTGHCAQGMVFAINPPPEGNERSFSAFQQRALYTGGVPATSSQISETSIYTPTYTPPPPQPWETATATVTSESSVWVTTYTSYEGTPQPTYAANGPQDHQITVGDAGQLAYSPANITGVAIGDTVTFTFRPKNHTVTQSTFDNPCQRRDGGFASGFQPVSADAQGDFPTFQITINDTAPIWGYCGQPGHCQQGMVFSINAVESGPNNFAAFQQSARASGNSTPSGSASSAAPSGTADGSGNDDGAIALSSGMMSGFLSVMLVSLSFFML